MRWVGVRRRSQSWGPERVIRTEYMEARGGEAGKMRNRNEEEINAN